MAQPQDNTAERMSAYLDHELAPAEAEEFENFLAASPEARRELDELRQMMQLVRNLPAVEAPADFCDKVSKKLRRRQLLRGDGTGLTLVSLPFQVLSIIVILTVAALYMMAELDEEPRGQLERVRPSSASAENGPSEPIP